MPAGIIADARENLVRPGLVPVRTVAPVPAFCSHHPAQRGKMLARFLTLGGLRKLEEVIEQEARQMPILDDIMDHKVLGREFKRGLAQGEEQGLENGRKCAMAMDRAGDILARAQKIVFIGYSLPEYDSFAERFFREVAEGKAIEAITPSKEHLERYRIAFNGRADLRDQRFEHCEYAAPPQ